VKFIIAIILLTLSATAHAQILKCVSKNGKIEFATSCPAGTKQQNTGVSSSRPAPAPAKDEIGAKDGKDGKGTDKGTSKDAKSTAKPDAHKSLAEKDAEFRKRKKVESEAAAKAEKAAADNARSKVACENARSYLKRLQERQRTSRTDPKTGERVFFEEADYVRETAAAERSVAENCK
jgi:hypothetical protein